MRTFMCFRKYTLKKSKWNLIIDLNKIKSIYIKKHKININFYFIIFSVLLMFLFLCQILKLSLGFMIMSILVSFFYIYLINRYRIFAVVIVFNDDLCHKFYFDKTKKILFCRKC
jgi:hypothetical protein